jgi:hypothetical protein
MVAVTFPQVCPIEECAQSWTKRLSDFNELVFNFRWNLRMDGALHDTHFLALLPPQESGL